MSTRPHMQHSALHNSWPGARTHSHHSCSYLARRYAANTALRVSNFQHRCPAAPGNQHRTQHSLRACSSSDDAGSAERPHQAHDVPSAAPSTVQPAEEEQDLNQVTTALNNAIAAEDYRFAAQLKDKLRQLSGGDAEATADWRALGIPEWLADRAERIGYRFPTEVQKRACRVLRGGADAIIQSSTGSGKTLAFVMPLLAALQYPPDAYPESFLGPQLLIVVPTRELGVQTVLLIYKLFGGSVHAGIPGDPTNMFSYTGPRGIRVKGCLDKEEVLRAKTNGWLFATTVVVGTPQCLAELCSEPAPFRLMPCVHAIAVDETDAYSQEQGDALEFLLGEALRERQQLHAQQLEQRAQQEGSQLGQEDEGLERQGEPAAGAPLKPQLALVGATPPPQELLERCVQQGWLRDPVTLRVGRQGIPAGLQHRYMVVDESLKLIAMCRQLRADLQQQGQDVAPARVMVFVRDEEAARAAAMPLRAGLWGDHTVSVLLPHGEEPIQALHAFRDNRATFLLATPQAARGLDLPAVSHVYNLDPPEDAVAYLHRAGRAGRVGSPVKGTKGLYFLGCTGIVTTLVAPDQRQQLLGIARELDLSITEVPVPSDEALREALQDDADPEAAKRALDDLFNLL